MGVNNGNRGDKMPLVLQIYKDVSAEKSFLLSKLIPPLSKLIPDTCQEIEGAFLTKSEGD